MSEEIYQRLKEVVLAKEDDTYRAVLQRLKILIGARTDRQVCKMVAKLVGIPFPTLQNWASRDNASLYGLRSLQLLEMQIQNLLDEKDRRLGIYEPSRQLPANKFDPTQIKDVR